MEYRNNYPNQYSYYSPAPQSYPPVPQGRKKSLLIGINYFGQKHQLSGCINDVHNMRNFLCSRYGFPSDANGMIILTDDQTNPYFYPSRTNMINAMKWLVGGAVPGDSLFFHYSGHGGNVPDKDGDEADGMDSCIYPADYLRSGPIIDDEINTTMVRYLPAGVKLTAIFDCCHSGTGMDLPYVYNHDGTLKRYNAGKQLMSGIMSDVSTRGLNVTSLVGGVLNVISGSGERAEKITQQNKGSYADIFMFSGCKDAQTSADTFVAGFGATGAMSYAFIQSLIRQPAQTYLSLLQSVREILHAKYQQKPQLSTAKPVNVNIPFSL